MKARTDELYDIINNFTKLQKDDKFSFSCVQCGECCKFYVNVMLNPLDIFRASEYLSLAPQDFIDKYCDIRQDTYSKLPYVKFSKSNSGEDTCHFHINRKCAIHRAKPASCALYPAGRIFNQENGGLSYFLQPSECEEKQKSQTLASVSLTDWLEFHGIKDDEAFTVQWHEWLHVTAGKIAAIFSESANLAAEVKTTLYSFLCVMLYLKYDTSIEFMPQFVKNCEETVSLIEMLLIS